MVAERRERNGVFGRPRVLFVCTANACRSQMAQAWCERLFGDRVEPLSAGTAPGSIDPLTLEVLHEAGLQTASLRPKPLAALERFAPFDLVVTVCDDETVCPRVPDAKKTVHAPFPDPPKLTRGVTDHEVRLRSYREVCMQIGTWIERELPRLLEGRL